MGLVSRWCEGHNTLQLGFIKISVTILINERFYGFEGGRVPLNGMVSPSLNGNVVPRWIGKAPRYEEGDRYEDYNYRVGKLSKGIAQEHVGLKSSRPRTIP